MQGDSATHRITKDIGSVYRECVHEYLKIGGSVVQRTSHVPASLLFPGE